MQRPQGAQSFEASSGTNKFLQLRSGRSIFAFAKQANRSVSVPAVRVPQECDQFVCRFLM